MRKIRSFINFIAAPARSVRILILVILWLSLGCHSELLAAEHAGPQLASVKEGENPGDNPEKVLVPAPDAKNWLSTVTLVPEYDLYYTSLALEIPLTSAPIPDLGDASETEVYRHLFFHALSPRFLLLEASVFPMPLAGVGVKKWAPHFYDHAGFGDDFNIIESITTGFPEPYAASFFIGDIVNFIKPGEKEAEGINRGYMGYLFSYSNQHIRRNTLIPDNNYEIEWKLKGERNFPGEHLNWSFRIGAKLHDNPDIQNALYVGIKRSNVSVHQPFLAWFDNSSFEVRLDCAQTEATLLRQEYLVGKSYPLPKWKSAMTLQLGFIWENPETYKGRLAYLDSHGGWTFVIRPQIEF